MLEIYSQSYRIAGDSESGPAPFPMEDRSIKVRDILRWVSNGVWNPRLHSQHESLLEFIRTLDSPSQEKIKEMTLEEALRKMNGKDHVVIMREKYND